MEVKERINGIMARRRIQPKQAKLIRTTVHPDLFNAIEKFRKEYMQNSGKYINNSTAHQALAKKFARFKAPKIKKRGKFNVI